MSLTITQRSRGLLLPAIIALFLLVTLAACGGSEEPTSPSTSGTTAAPTAAPTPTSTTAPDATTASPPTATSIPASTPTPKPTEAAEAGESAGISRETREYIEAFCSLSTVEESATWGELADQGQKAIDFIEKNEPPEELRDLLEALVAWQQVIIKFAEERPSLSADSQEAWTALQSEEGAKDAFFALDSAQETLDPAVMEVLNNSDC